jgi:hypothetical protein
MAEPGPPAARADVGARLPYLSNVFGVTSTASNTLPMRPEPGRLTMKAARPRAARAPTRASTARQRLRATARGLLGAFSLVGGLTWLLLNMQGTHPVLDTAVSLVLAAGGLVLLMPHRITLPRRVTGLAAAGAALAGTGAGLAATASQASTLAYVVARGWPFHWLQRGGVADDPETARRIALAADWQVDGVALAADLLVWAYAGMLIVVVGVLIRRSARERRPEHRTVGPLP